MRYSYKKIEEISIPEKDCKEITRLFILDKFKIPEDFSFHPETNEISWKSTYHGAHNFHFSKRRPVSEIEIAAIKILHELK